MTPIFEPVEQRPQTYPLAAPMERAVPVAVERPEPVERNAVDAGLPVPGDRSISEPVWVEPPDRSQRPGAPVPEDVSRAQSQMPLALDSAYRTTSVGPTAVDRGDRNETLAPVAMPGERNETAAPVAMPGERNETAAPVAMPGERNETDPPDSPDLAVRRVHRETDLGSRIEPRDGVTFKRTWWV
jgi:hypothetical protein